jgi:hypothetical protein
MYCFRLWERASFSLCLISTHNSTTPKNSTNYPCLSFEKTSYFFLVDLTNGNDLIIINENQFLPVPTHKLSRWVFCMSPESLAFFMSKYIFLTGGVVSSVDKGITATSMGTLMKSRQITVSIQKHNPYLNVEG